VIVWLSSFPRSGNTFFRVALHRLYQVPTYVVYDVDGVAEQVGTELMDARDRPTSFEQMRASSEVYFVKTHRQRNDPVITGQDRAICLVRDGRDCVVSWARMNTAHLADQADYSEHFAAEAHSIITRRSGGTGGWGQNVLSWQQSKAPAPVWIRFEDLIADPRRIIEAAINEVAPGQKPADAASIPSFEDLQEHDSAFFRAGRTGTHKTELPPALHGLFWAQPDNRTAMQHLGYRRTT
jgi:hypothetical protein